MGASVFLFPKLMLPRPHLRTFGGVLGLGMSMSMSSTAFLTLSFMLFLRYR